MERTNLELALRSCHHAGRSRSTPGFRLRRGGGRSSESAALRGELLLSVHGGLRTLLKRLAVPDHAFAGVVRELEILGEFERIGRASIFAEAAEHTAAQVVGKVRQLLAAGLFIALAGDHDQVFRTSQSAQIAGNAESLVGVWVDIQARRASVTLGGLRPLQRILLGLYFC